jgi:hypothetical protein
MPAIAMLASSEIPLRLRHKPVVRFFARSHVQFTNRLMRMFITIPKARNVNKTEDPP